jgi:hypothetical protein
MHELQFQTVEPKPTRRRWYQFSIGAIFVVVTIIALFLGWLVNRPPPPPIRVPTSPAEVKALVAHVNGPAKKVGFIRNVQVPAAVRLGYVGPLAKQYGAIEALNALIATTNDLEAKKAAEDALKMIYGR